MNVSVVRLIFCVKLQRQLVLVESPGRVSHARLPTFSLTKSCFFFHWSSLWLQPTCKMYSNLKFNLHLQEVLQNWLPPQISIFLRCSWTSWACLRQTAGEYSKSKAAKLTKPFSYLLPKCIKNFSSKLCISFCCITLKVQIYTLLNFFLDIVRYLSHLITLFLYKCSTTHCI